jgi:hypothetical protein
MTNRVTASLYSYLYMTYRPTMYMCHRHRWHTKMYQHTIEVVHNVHLVSSWGVPSVPMAHKNVPAYHRGGAQCPSGLHRRGAIGADGTQKCTSISSRWCTMSLWSPQEGCHRHRWQTKKRVQVAGWVHQLLDGCTSCWLRGQVPPPRPYTRPPPSHTHARVQHTTRRTYFEI